MSPPPGSSSATPPDGSSGSDFVQRGQALVAEGQYQEAARVCRLGLLSHPTIAEGRVVLATALAALGNHDDVLAELRAVLEQDPHNVQALELRGAALLALGRNAEAQDALDIALQLGSDNSPTLPSDTDPNSAGGAPYYEDEQSGEIPVLSEPASWGEDDEDDELTSIMDDPPDLAALEAGEKNAGDGDGGGDEKGEEDDDERYVTAPWLPPSYLERMRRGAAQDAFNSYVSEEETLAEHSEEVNEAGGGIAPVSTNTESESGGPAMVDDSDTVSLAEDYQELVEKSQVETEQPEELVDDGDTVSLAEDYQELVAKAKTETDEPKELVDDGDTVSLAEDYQQLVAKAKTETDEPKELVDDNDTVSLAEDYQELVAKVSTESEVLGLSQDCEQEDGGAAGDEGEETLLDDGETKSLSQDYEAMLAAAFAEEELQHAAAAPDEAAAPAVAGETEPFEPFKAEELEGLEGELTPMGEEETIAALIGDAGEVPVDTGEVPLVEGDFVVKQDLEQSSDSPLRVDGLPSPEDFLKRVQGESMEDVEEEFTAPAQVVPQDLEQVPALEESPGLEEEEIEASVVEPGDPELHEDLAETGVGVDQDLLLESMGRAVNAGPVVTPHPDDDSSAALVDPSLLSEWGRAEGTSDLLEDDLIEAEEDPGESTVAQEVPGFGRDELKGSPAPSPFSDEMEEPPTLAGEAPAPPGEFAQWAESESEEDFHDQTSAMEQPPLQSGPLDSAEEEWEEIAEEEWEEFEGEEEGEVDLDDQTMAQGYEAIKSEEWEELGTADQISMEEEGEDELTAARGPEPLGPLDEAGWGGGQESGGDPAAAQVVPGADHELGFGDVDDLDQPYDDGEDLDEDDEQTVARGAEPLPPEEEPDWSEEAGSDVWGSSEAPRVPDQSTRSIDLEPGADLPGGMPLVPAESVVEPDGEIPQISDVSLVPDGDMEDVEEHLRPLSTDDLSEISIEMVLDEDQMPPLPEDPLGGAPFGGAGEGWEDVPAALPPFAVEEEGFGEPYGYEEEEEEEEDYNEATQVRVDLPKLQAMVSEELSAEVDIDIPMLDEGLDAEFPADDDLQEEETGFFEEENYEEPYSESYEEPYGDQGGVEEGYGEQEAYGMEETPAGVEGFPGADPFGAVPVEAPATLDGGPMGYNPPQPEEVDEPPGLASAPAQIPPAADEAQDWRPQVERTENMRASVPGPYAEPEQPEPRYGTPPESRAQPQAEIHDARGGDWANDAQRANQASPPHGGDVPPGGSARLDQQDRTGTNIFAMIKGRPGSKRLPLLIAGTIGVILLAFGIGRVVRHLRLGDQIEEKRTKAARQLMAGNILDYMAASQSYAEIIKHRPEDLAALWAQSRVQAAIPFEFGDPNPQASHRGGEKEETNSDRLAADAYAALFTGSLSRANKILSMGRKALPSSAVLAYLEGRVRLLEGKPAPAAELLRQAVKLEPGNTLFNHWLAESLAEKGEIKASLDAHSATLKLNPNHVGTLIGRGRLLLESRGDLGKAQKDLDSVLTGARSSLASKGQRGWASALLARIYLSRGDLTRSRAFLTKARTNQPTRDALFLDQLALAYLESYQMGEAERVIQESRDLLPERPHPYYHLAMVFSLQGRHSRALISLRKAKGLNSPAAILLKARILFSLGRHGEALAEINAILDQSGGHLQANLLQAEILAAQGKGTEAEQSLLALLPSHRRSVELLTTLGEVYLKLGRTHQARQRLAEVIRIDRFAFKARLKLAEVYLMEGQYTEAHKRLSEAARTNMGNTVAMRKLAELEFAMGNLGQARTLFKSLTKRSGNDPDVHLGNARVLAALHEEAAADKAVRAAESRQADRLRAALVKGEIYLARGSAQLAISHLLAATGGKAPPAEALHLLVQAHLMNNDEGSAKEVVRRLSSHHPGSPEALAAAGRLELYAGNFSRASKSFSQALQVLRTAPRPPLEKSRILVLAGRAQQDNGQSALALAQYEEAAKACPRCPQPHYRTGLVHDENERYSAAIASLRRAKSLDPKMKEVYYDLGQVLEHAGRTGEAASAYKTYLGLKPPRELAEAAKEALEALGQ